jgi:protein-tyrosine phosphatase
MAQESELSVLFVCMGNICRSPTAQGVVEQHWRLRSGGRPARFDSAGTHAYHIGQAPDRRTLSAAAARGYDLAAQRARQVVSDDFEHFDLVLAMDRDNLAHLRRMAPSAAQSRVRLLLDYHEDPSLLDVPDPFYGDALGFERVLDLVEAAASALVNELLEKH